MAVDRNISQVLLEAVRAVLVDEATRRSESGRPVLDDVAMRALSSKAARDELRSIDQRRIADRLPRLTEQEETALVASVVAMSVGLGPFDVLLADPTVEDICATRFDCVFTYHSDGSCKRHEDAYWDNEKAMADEIAFIARSRGRTERQFNAQHPLLTMRIGRGLRLAAQRDVSENVSFTLRRNTLGKVAIADLVGMKMFPQVIGDLLLAFANAPEMRVAIGGATGAGKTTVMRAMTNDTDELRRLIIIEDTAELDLFDANTRANVESWEQREANSEGEGMVPLSELVKQGLRVRPDLLIVGEVRGSDAAIPMLEAMTHGQASITTVHADDAMGVLNKLALFLGKGEDSMNSESAHNNLSQALDFVVHVDRGVNGQRFVSEVLEVSGFDGKQVTTQPIYTAHDGDGHTMHRLTDSHLRKLERAGFNPDRLGQGWR